MTTKISKGKKYLEHDIIMLREGKWFEIKMYGEDYIEDIPFSKSQAKDLRDWLNEELKNG